MIEQLAIDGNHITLTPDGVMKVTRRVMHEKPVTYKSHRMLMIEIAKVWGFRWDKLEKAQQYILERLFDLSPDIERNARKVRDEDAASAPKIPLVVAPQLQEEPDPFLAVERETKQREAQRKRWRR